MPHVGFRDVPEEFQAGGDFREKIKEQAVI
jgi:hypothetical protein